ncbi:MAG: hypothetical protein FH758_06290 [Firmicutes bacterium]|nr:hypothetical protein [Bacillota bacterium]
MKRKPLISILTLLLVLLGAVTAYGADVPPLFPSLYDAQVEYEDGTPVESGCILRAYIDGVQASYDEDVSSTIDAGSVTGFLVQGGPPFFDNYRIGETIEFKVVIDGTEYLAEPEVAVTWQIGDELDIKLTVQTNPTSPPPTSEPTVETNTASDVTKNSATLNGTIANNGGAAITEYGFMWGTEQSSLTKKQVGTNDTTGAYTADLDGLAANTTYYYQAYAANSEGTANGDIETFTTNEESINISASMSMPTISGKPGDVVQVPVNFESTGGVAAVEFLVDFDDQLLTLQSVEAGDLTQGFSINSNEVDGAHKVMIFDIPVDTIPQGTGTIAVLNFQVKDTAQSGATCALEFSSIEASDAEGNGVDFTSTNGGFEVTGPVQGDVNGDGQVTVADVVQVVNFALEKVTPSQGQFNAADINGDGRISVADVVALVNIALEETD